MSKTQGCIKTGCVVSFPNYGSCISADVYRVADALVIKTHPNQADRGLLECHHEYVNLVVASDFLGREFWRADIGVFVLPESACQWTNEVP